MIGNPTTTVLAGNCDYGYGLFSGFRITGGFFKGEDRRVGLELSGFLLEQNAVDFFAASDPNGVPVLARPFVDATNGSQGVFTVSFPNLGSLASGASLSAWLRAVRVSLPAMRSTRLVLLTLALAGCAKPMPGPQAPAATPATTCGSK